MSRTNHKDANSSWSAAADLLQSYVKTPQKADSLLESLRNKLSQDDARRAQRLYYGTLRNKLRIEALICQLCSKAPKKGLHAILSLAIFEIMESPDRLPAIVDHAVRQTKAVLSRSESGFVNAVLRKVPAAIEALPESLSVKYSHPEWLIDHWQGLFGKEETQALLEWNQKEPKLYFRSPTPLPSEHFAPSPWTNFYQHTHGSWSEIAEYLKLPGVSIQDPSTATGPALARIKDSDKVLDLCAAPGGKSRILADALDMEGIVVGVDLPKRCDRLEENYAKITNTRHAIIAADVLELSTDDFKKRSLPELFDIVYVDVPCSNTGVIRRRPDVKWRLQPDHVSKVAALQKQLIKKAAAFVKPAGSLIYSTCSIEPEENEELIEDFLKHNPAFTLEKQSLLKPWQDDCDGAGAFLLRKAAQS